VNIITMLVQGTDRSCGGPKEHTGIEIITPASTMSKLTLYANTFNKLKKPD